MSQEQAHQFSIKNKLKHHQLPPNEFTASTSLTPKQSHSKIYTPQYYNYFLNTIEKEIKHQGSLLKRIKRKIQDFKDQQKEKKRIKNSKHCHSHLMFNTLSIRKDRPLHTPNQSAYNIELDQLNRKYLKSAVPSARETIKIKTSSFTNTRLKTANQKRQPVKLQVSNFNQSKTSNYNQNELLQKYAKAKKPIKVNKDLSIMGSQPQWRNFQSYRNNSTYMLKKRY